MYLYAPIQNMVYRYKETKKETNAGDNIKPLTEKKFLRIFKNDI